MCNVCQFQETTVCPNCGNFINVEYLRHDTLTGRAVCCTICLERRIRELEAQHAALVAAMRDKYIRDGQYV